MGLPWVTGICEHGVASGPSPVWSGPRVPGWLTDETTPGEQGTCSHGSRCGARRTAPAQRERTLCLPSGLPACPSWSDGSVHRGPDQSCRGRCAACVSRSTRTLSAWACCRVQVGRGRGGRGASLLLRGGMGLTPPALALTPAWLQGLPTADGLDLRAVPSRGKADSGSLRRARRRTLCGRASVRVPGARAPGRGPVPSPGLRPQDGGRLSSLRAGTASASESQSGEGTTRETRRGPGTWGRAGCFSWSGDRPAAVGPAWRLSLPQRHCVGGGKGAVGPGLGSGWKRQLSVGSRPAWAAAGGAR